MAYALFLMAHFPNYLGLNKAPGDVPPPLHPWPNKPVTGWGQRKISLGVYIAAKRCPAPLHLKPAGCHPRQAPGEASVRAPPKINAIKEPIEYPKAQVYGLYPLCLAQANYCRGEDLLYGSWQGHDLI